MILNYCYIIIIIIIILLLRSNTEYYQSNIDGLKYNIITSFGSKSYNNSANRMAEINIFIINFLRHMKVKYILNKNDADPIKVQITQNLLERYNPDTLKENNPNSTLYTSYVLNKGEEIAFCLREKKSGKNKIHDINTTQFVVLHELSHIGCNYNGHGIPFWKCFKFLINEAFEAGLYIPVNYHKNPTTYCGIKITSNPFFNPILKLY